jgi:hypothetical protein
MLKTASLTVIAAALAASFALPASAKPRSCDDYAWESQAMKDCKARPEKMEHRAKAHHKAMKHDDMKDMKHDGMKDMKHDKT